MAAALDIHLFDSGPGSGASTVLCLHGIGSSSRSFARQAEAFPPRARLVAWDAPGYGESPDPPEGFALGDYVAEAAHVIDELGEGPVHLLGVSWGGVIACALAVEHPDLVRGLILAASSAGAGLTDEQAAGMRERAAELERLGGEAFAEARAPRLVSADAPSSLVAEVADNMRSAIRLPGYGLATESMAATDLRPQLASVRAPTLVLCGDRDEVTGPAQSQILAGGIPHAVMVTIHGAGHVANQEAPGHFNDWVLAYLDIAESQNGR